MAENKALIKQNYPTIKGFLEKNKAQIDAALPAVGLTADRITRIALTSIRQDEKLLQCTPASLFKAVMEAASLGLTPDGVLGQAYLIPYGTEAVFQIGYRGMIELARRSGQIQNISAHPVFEKDEFDYQLGLDEKLTHKPFMDGDRGVFRAAYAVARFKDGGHQIMVLTKVDVDRHRGFSKSPNSPAWRNHYPAMGVKSAVRMLSKLLPMSSDVVDLVRVAQRDELLDMGVLKPGEGLDMITDTTGETVGAEEPANAWETHADAMSERMKVPEGTEPPPPIVNYQPLMDTWPGPGEVPHKEMKATLDKAVEESNLPMEQVLDYAIAEVDDFWNQVKKRLPEPAGMFGASEPAPGPAKKTKPPTPEERQKIMEAAVLKAWDEGWVLADGRTPDIDKVKEEAKKHGPERIADGEIMDAMDRLKGTEEYKKRFSEDEVKRLTEENIKDLLNDCTLYDVAPATLVAKMNRQGHDIRTLAEAPNELYEMLKDEILALAEK